MAVFLVFGFAFEVGEDVIEFVFVQAVQAGDDGVEFGEVVQAFLFVPFSGVDLPAQPFDEGFKVDRVVGQVDEDFVDAFFDGCVAFYTGGLFELFGWEDWELVEDEIAEVDSLHLCSHNIVNYM